MTNLYNDTLVAQNTEYLTQGACGCSERMCALVENVS